MGLQGKGLIMNTYQIGEAELQGVVGGHTYDSYFNYDSMDFEEHQKSQYGLSGSVSRVFESAASIESVQALKAVDGVYSLILHSDEKVDDLARKEVLFSEVVAVSVPEMITTIKDVFGLNLSQLARVVNVSRPTVYNHLKGEGSVDCYDQLYGVALQVRKHYSSVSCVLKSVKVNGKTLLGHLQSGNYEPDLIIEYVHEAMKKQPDKVANNISHLEQVKRNLASQR